MNPWDDDADVVEPQNDQQQQRNPLRDVVKSLESSLKERDERLSKMEQALRQRDVSEILGEVGADRRVVKFIPATVDATPEAVKAWWEENKGVFAGASTTGEPQSAGNVPDEPQGQPAVDKETQDRWERISRLTQSPGVSEPDRAAAAEAMLQGAKAASTNSLGHVDPNLLKEFLQGTRSVPS